MEHCTKKPGDEKEIPVFGPDSIEVAMRRRIRETIEAMVKEELEAALGAGKSARVGDDAQGYRHGTRERTLTTSLGPTTIAMPRARVRARGRDDARSGAARRSAAISAGPTRVDEAILGVYLAGGEHAADQGRAGAAAAGRAAVEGCGVAAGGPACARTSRRGGSAIWPTRTSGTCSWTAGIRRCASAGAASACPCW